MIILFMIIDYSLVGAEDDVVHSRHVEDLGVLRKEHTTAVPVGLYYMLHFTSSTTAAIAMASCNSIR